MQDESCPGKVVAVVEADDQPFAEASEYAV